MASWPRKFAPIWAIRVWAFFSPTRASSVPEFEHLDLYSSMSLGSRLAPVWPGLANENIPCTEGLGVAEVEFGIDPSFFDVSELIIFAIN